MLNRISRTTGLLSLSAAALALVWLEAGVGQGLVIAVALVLAWTTGVADGHAHLRKRNPDAFAGGT